MLKLYLLILQAYENVKNKTGEQQVRNADNGKVEEQDITELEFSVSVTVLDRDGSDVRGLARIFLEDSFVINNVTIIRGKEKLFVSLPSYKTKDVDENNKVKWQERSLWMSVKNRKSMNWHQRKNKEK